MTRFILALFATLGVSASAADDELSKVLEAKEAAASRIIVDTAFVREVTKRGAVLWDTRPADDYKKGHIPGAVNVGDPLKMLREDNSEDFVSTDLIAQILGNAGIDPSKEIVAYGLKANPSAYFAAYAIGYFGGKRVYVYHGGIDDWKAAGQTLTVDAADLPAVTLKLQADDAVVISTREVREKLNNQEVQILDVRTAREFAGEDIRALRGGHIPGAVNIPYERNWAGAPPRQAGQPAPTPQEMLSLKSPEDLQSMYAKLDPNKETIVYCQSGSRSSVTAAILKDLGFKNVRMYDGSWLEYGNTLDAPAENATFFNVGLMTNRMAVMQRRIEELEKELAAIKAKQ
jgi:thiosulfate/3-mercaptopyruvate sulfurtransferase